MCGLPNGKEARGRMKLLVEKSFDTGEVVLNYAEGPARAPSANLRFFKIEGYSFLEQNPRKSSHLAKLAREGHLIMWVMKGRRYLGQVRDGVFYDLR